MKNILIIGGSGFVGSAIINELARRGEYAGLCISVPTRLLPIGHGKNQPIATNKTEDGRQLNRRVEFQLTTKSPEHTALQSR